MRSYAIMHHPSHNRVYFETSLKLSAAEFQIAAQYFSVPCENVQHQNIYGVDYLTFQTEGELTAEDVQKVFGLSFVYAFFERIVVNEEMLLRPIQKVKENFVDESISTILKYTGKTNEIFTRMMINVAFYSLEKAGERGGGRGAQSSARDIHLLDPIAGKGTTLYEGLIKGYHVHGIEIGDKVVHESGHFLRKFLENGKYKFDYSSLRISGPNKSFSALKHTFEAAATKEDFKNKRTKLIELVAGNSLYADQYYKKNYFDLIVGDLPYGVQHGNVTTEKQSSLTRNPAQLLSACLPAWHAVLKPGGVITLAWNCNVLSREKLAQILEEHGFCVKNEDPYTQFEHRVDQAILRDIVVGVKK